MKKILSMILAVCLSCSVIQPVFAETDTDALQALILSVKERIGNTDEYSEFTSRESQNELSGTSYSLQWTAPEKDYKSMYVTVTEKGTITRYSCEYAVMGDNRPKINTISREVALENAKKLVKKLNPGICDELLIYDDYLSASLWENTFTFSIKRVHNGIPVPENSGSVTLDEKAEKITYFRIEFDENATFDSNETIISKTDAEKSFSEKLGLVMEYDAKYEKDSISAFPIYRFKASEKKISALDGNIIIPNKYYYGAPTLNGAMKEESVQDSAAGLTRAELENLELVSGLVSKEEGIAKIYANKYIAIDDAFELEGFYTYKVYGKKDEYTGSFEFRNKESGKYASVTMNLNSGEILNFYTSEIKAEVQKMTEEQGRTFALEAFKALAGDKYSEYKNNEEFNEVKVSDSVNTRVNLNFTRYVNGIPFPRDTVHITVDLKSGTITSYNIEYADIEFPSLEKAITHDEACRKLFEQNEYELVYAKNVQDSKIEFKLVYDFEQTYISMDAYTGEIEKYNSEETQFTGYTDISGHYAEEIINILAQYGVRTEGDKFTPDEKITYGDFSKLLGCIARRYGSVWLKSEISNEELGWMYSQGILASDDQPDVNASVSRLSAAELLVKAIGAKEFAELNGIYLCPFNDVTEKVGYVSILYGMGIFKGDGNGNFNPNENITYAEAAVMLYNYLMRA